MKFKDVVNNLNILKLDKMASCLSEYVDKVNSEKIPFLDALLELTKLEIANKAERSSQFNIRIAHFPYYRTFEDFDFSGNPHLDKIRDWFLLLCWTGCRYSDLDKLSKEYIRNDLFQFRQQKTNNIVAIPLHPTVKKILKKYNGEIPAPISNQKFNAGLKEAMRIIGIDETIKIKHTIGGVLEEEDYKKYELISSHTGRRSFASNAYLAGIPSITIMKITGHKTESAFLKYIKITPEEHARKMAEASA